MADLAIVTHAQSPSIFPAALAAQRAVDHRAARAAAARAERRQAAARQAPSGFSAPPGSARQIAQQLLDITGEGGQFPCLDSLWSRESGWNVTASNPGTGAYGIPQALPGAKMASAGEDWQTDAATQIRWGLSYIDSLYGSRAVPGPMRKPTAGIRRAGRPQPGRWVGRGPGDLCRVPRPARDGRGDRRRGLAGDIDQIRRRLRLHGPHRATIVLTRVNDLPWGLICADPGSPLAAG
jgi:hypothetical protein